MIKALITTTLILGTLMASALPKYETKTLKNGLEIVVIPLKNSTNVISTDIFYKVGAVTKLWVKLVSHICLNI